MSNRLVNENSPYLLQHSENPVDWYPWGPEALDKAKSENKPIFLSIGYAACHWCHVMAHESFEDDSIAALMNGHFINIKVDREERPDLDSIYMSATQAMTGSGGWPMSVFLTPGLQPFYAGTYFPPVHRYNMPSFREVLQALANVWENERDKAVESAERVTTHIQAIAAVSQFELELKQEHLDGAVKSLLEGYDWGYGGWGDAPKFPQPMAIEFLLRRYAAGNEEAIKPVIHALDAMSRGGTYDVVGGGFSRYSTDNFWRVPHFEKMLYDNALLARAYLHAWQVTGGSRYIRIVQETLDFVTREMTHPEGGFYSSLDADSEGEEGKFYVWTADEIKVVLGEEYNFFQTAYGVSEQGNWEGKTVLQRAIDDGTLAARFGMDVGTATAKLSECHSKLLAARSERTRPGTDDKVLASWNGLMLVAIAEAARIFPDAEKRKHYYKMATRNASFLISSLYRDGSLRRLWRAGKTTNEVFLEDYGAVTLGLLELYQTDFENRWFTTALELASHMLKRFSDPTGGFFDTPDDGEVLVLRPKDLQDNAIPCGNSLACEALLKLATLTDQGNYRDLAEQALRTVGEAVLRYPTAFGRWLSAADFSLANVKQVAVVYQASPSEAQELLQTIQSAYRPNMVVAASSYPPPENAPALLMDRPLKGGEPTVYVCEGFECKMPVTTILDLQGLL
jgi:uncharacterized protein YyaL (SSP411 family)